MRADQDYLVGFLTGLCGVGLVTFLTFPFGSISKKELVERGYAEYNQTTGDWQWKEHVTLTNYVTVTNEVGLVGTLEGPHAKPYDLVPWPEGLPASKWVIGTNYWLKGVERQ